MYLILTCVSLIVLSGLTPPAGPWIGAPLTAVFGVFVARDLRTLPAHDPARDWKPGKVRAHATVYGVLWFIGTYVMSSIVVLERPWDFWVVRTFCLILITALIAPAIGLAVEEHRLIRRAMSDARRQL